MASSSYPWPSSSVNVGNFVTVKPWLKGDERKDFKVWRQQMLCLLNSQNVPEGEAPPPDDSDEYKAWRRTDWLVKGWILGSIGKDALEAVWEKETAMDVWQELHKLFDDEKDSSSDEEESGDGGLSRQLDAAEKGGDSTKYLALYRAAQRGDWETAKVFFQDINELGTTIISSDGETALHVAVLTGKANDFVKKVVELLPADVLTRKNSFEDTALHNAASVGNTEAAMVMVNKNPDLITLGNDCNELPVMIAAKYCHKSTLELLISKHEEKPEYNVFEGSQGVRLLIYTIASEFLDVALDLVEKHPNLAVQRDVNGLAPLPVIAETDTFFPRLESLSWWETFIYHCIPLKQSRSEASRTTSVASDIENVRTDGAAHNYSTSFQIISRVGQKTKFMIWTAIEYLFPNVEELKNMKVKHQQALKLAEYVCDQLLSLPENEASNLFWGAMKQAADYGRSDIVEMIMHKYPKITFHEDSDGRNVFLLAASFRFQNIINLIYTMSDRKYKMYDCSDKQQNNLMHICGKLAPPHRLNLVPGAALQMQRELQWFKEMEKYVHPSRRTWENKEDQTPQMIFTKEHNKLKADGEKWMKDTANACTIAAALIATVMFAAAFTVPGGLDSSTGIPLLSSEPAFDLFAVSDAISLFTSILSLLMFLSILTSRYAEEDFLYVLPKRLSIGLLSLFVSITSMMVAYFATFYLVLRKNGAWYQLLLGAVACLPVTSFVLLQFPLLVDVVWSTYGPGIFGKKTHRLLY